MSCLGTAIFRVAAVCLAAASLLGVAAGAGGAAGRADAAGRAAAAGPAAGATPAGAATPTATPTLYELPPATHAYSLSVGGDGTLWWVPSRGTAYQGAGGPVLGKLAPDGTVGEQAVAGLGPISATAVAPDGGLWLLARRKLGAGVAALEVGRLSASGQLEEHFTVGRGRTWIGPATATADAVWFVAHPYAGPQSIVRVDAADGAVRRFKLPRHCKSAALAAAGRTVWFTEGCDHLGRRKRSTRSSIGRIDPTGRLVRYPIAKRDDPVSLAIGANGAVWFGAAQWDYEATPRIGLINSAGRVVEYPIPRGEPDSIAVGTEGRLWFPHARGLYRFPYLISIGANGDLGTPVCAEPNCYLEPAELTAAPDGGLWYTLHQPVPLEAGGGALISWSLERANEAGLIGHLGP